MSLLSGGPLPRKVVDNISSFLCYPGDLFTAFEPNIGCGENLERLLDGTTGVGFGVEPDETKCMNARAKGFKVIKGAFERAKISNGVFSLTLLIPDCGSAVPEDETFSERNEKALFRDVTPYVTPGGVVVFIVPKFRFDESIIKMLAYRLDDLRMFRFTDPGYSMLSQVVVFGTKKKQPFLDADVLEYWRPYISEELGDLSEAMFPFYNVPPMEPDEVKLFRSNLIDVEELEQLIAASPVEGSIKSTLEGLKAREEVHPPAPLHRGQIGILLPSGALNGIVGSGESLHIVKGRAVKDKLFKVDDATGDEIEQDLLKCTVKVFKPNGELVTLVG